MRSTEMMYDIVDKYGHNDKEVLVRMLRAFRTQIVKESTQFVRKKVRELYTLSETEQELYGK